ncbi:hypothetical protein KSS87_017313 [Heliosperma pusillum]|nr:hypothetical protein KSS87_017313 [Heliosperma pusillum]
MTLCDVNVYNLKASPDFVSGNPLTTVSPDYNCFPSESSVLQLLSGTLLRSWILFYYTKLLEDGKVTSTIRIKTVYLVEYLLITMTLEDFFTLTEMKDGLTALARVEELIAVMKKKDGVVKNVGDMTRHWAAVASTIAATENKECLDLFIQLDGLCFIDKWLKEAETLANEAVACFVEEAISALLQAAEKLQIDNERLVSSEICITVKGLLSYKSLEVRDKARSLLDSWKFKNFDIESMDVDYVLASDDTKKITEHPESQGIVNDASHAKIPCDQMSNGTEGEKIKSTVDHNSSLMDSGPGIMKEELPDSVAKLDSILNDPSVKEVLCSSDGYSVSQVLSAPNQGTIDVIPVQCEHICEEKRHGNELEDRPEYVDKVAASSSCVASKGIDILSNTDVTVIESTVYPDMDTYEFYASEKVLSKTSSFDDTNRPIGESTNELGLEEDNDKNDSGNLEQKCLEQGIGYVVVDAKDKGTTVFRLEEDGKDNESKKQRKSKKKFGRSSKFARLTKTSKNADLIQQTANMELEDGTFDALKVARLVAKEVEREVGDYDEKSGSSSSYTSSISDRSTEGGISHPSSPESINGEQNLPLEDGPTNELQTMEDMTPEAPVKEPYNGSATTETNLEINLQDMESSQLTDAVREAGSNTEKCLLEFDLNQEFLSEELDQNQVHGISNPVSVVSASRVVVAPGNSAGPLKFEGSLGWKGSAATSAFRPAPPRRTSDRDTGGATSSSSRQRQVFLDIDLIVAQGSDVKVVDHMQGKEKQILGSLPSGESSVKMNCKISERLKFDLNQTEDDGSQWKMGGLLLGPTKWGRSPSPGSSSSCIQPASRSFDLNDNPCIGNDPSTMQPFPWNLSSNSKVNHQEDSVISLLGTKIKKGTFPPQTESAFVNDKAPEPLTDTNMLRGMGFGPAIPYPQSVYGYNGLAMGHVAPAPIYGPGGPIPYMFDTRGTPFYGTVPSSYSHPYMMGSSPAPNVDLNSGNRDPAFFRQLFIPGQGRPLENSRPLSSGSSGGKRKEPDTGWELYPANFKPPHQPPRF